MIAIEKVIEENQANHPSNIIDKTMAEKTQRNRQLLEMFHRLMQIEESAWGRFFRFEKSQYFREFERKHTFKQVFRLRIDDIIYVIFLLFICVVFAVLPSVNYSGQMTTLASQLISAYRFMLAFLLTGSIMWLISTNGYRHFIFLFICVGLPLLTLLTYQGVIPFDQIDASTTIYTYLNILTLWVIYGALYVVYPLKQFIRSKIGSLYSYLFALSTLTLLLIWPSYSLLMEFIQNQQITFNFITQNRPLIITFLVIIIFSFHLLTHKTFFEGDILETKRILLTDFTKGELNQALVQIEFQRASHNNQQPFLLKNFTAYSRIMSFLVFAFTTGIEVYVFLRLADNLSDIYRGVGVMIFCLAFPTYGCIMNLLPISRESVLYFFSIFSLIPAALSPLYCYQCTTSFSFTFYEYLFLATALPYTTIFWCVVRSLSRRRPFLKTNMLVILYAFFHIPITFLVVNNLEMISTQTSTVSLINIILLSVVGLITVVGVCGFIIWLCISVKELPKEQKEKDTVIDYNYFEQGNPPYVPYQKKQSFSLTWLSSLDIRNISELFNCLAFIFSELATMYIFNLLSTPTYISTSFVDQTSKYVIYSQFFISFAYFTYAYSYIIFKHNENGNIIMLVVLIVLALFGVIFSYVRQEGLYLAFRIGGGVSFAMFAIGIGLHVVKRNNKEIMNFVSGILTILIWIFLIIPYAIALPIVSIFVTSDQYGVFVYSCILGTTLLLIVLVSILSIVFNVLMDKFQGQKKIKFIIEDVETFLRDEGVETEDQVLHVLFESYEYRDQKYVFFMKRGYPIRLYKDPEDKDNGYKTVVYNHESLNKKQSTMSIIEDEKPVDYCWNFLTCLCGVDQNQMEDKIAKVSGQNLIDEEQMQDLMPQDFFRNVFVRATRSRQKDDRRQKDLSKLFSSKSIILKHLRKVTKHLGQEYSIMKNKKNKNFNNQILHLIFDFLSNQDDPPAKIIYNDLLIFCSIVNLPNLQTNAINEIYNQFSTHIWKGANALDIDDFSIVIQVLAEHAYPISPESQQRKYQFLVQAVYPYLCEYAEFQDAVNQRRIKATKRISSSRDDDSERGGKNMQRISSFMKNKNVHSLTEQQLQRSPFHSSFQRYLKKNERLKLKKEKFNEKRELMQKNKLVQPAKEDKMERREKKQEKIKEKSCKLKIYEKYNQCKNCCKKIQEEQVVVKRKKVKPWEYLAVQSIRIMQHKETQWKEQRKEKEYQFRIILNNIMIAIFKLADLYTFMQITIMNPEIGWQSQKQFGVLILQYRTQLYISFAVVLVCGVLGVKGITYIFEDRLGLTETRVPAVFPHPMFFFTFIYKLLILSLFNTVIMTLFSTFMCNWTGSNSTVFSMKLLETDIPLQCFSAQHNIYIICSIISIILYYPLSAYTMPNFQFAEKRLDLKYKPSYLIIYFQVNFVLAAGKVLLSSMAQKSNTQIETVQVLFQSINIFCIGLLAVMIVLLRPCLIGWFNVIDFLVIWIGLIWNVLGLVLYITGQGNWELCIIIGSIVSGISIILSIIFIRKRFFSPASVSDEAGLQQIGEIEMGWKYRKQYNTNLVKFSAIKLMEEKDMNKKEGVGKDSENGKSEDLKKDDGEETKTNMYFV